MTLKGGDGAMSTEMWDGRYAASDLVWSSTPNTWVEQLASGLRPGRALDLAGGEGRNALWLAERGWDATVVDFSGVALERAQALAAQRLGERVTQFHVEQADLLHYSPHLHEYDLVLVVYLQIPAEERWLVLRAAAAALAPGGRLIVVAHDSRNLEHGFGGPQDPSPLYSAQDIVDDLEVTDLVVERADTGTRAVTTDSGPHNALDAIVVVRASGAS
jgi:SAM-dependent methyltransferase